MHGLTTLKKSISSLRATQSPFTKAVIAEEVLDKTYEIIESQQSRITVLENMVQTLIRKGQSNA